MIEHKLCALTRDYKVSMAVCLCSGSNMYGAIGVVGTHSKKEHRTSSRCISKQLSCYCLNRSCRDKVKV